MNIQNGCRICLEEVDNVVSYCDCVGTTSPIHLECLEKWIKTKNNFTCEICKKEYNVEVAYNYYSCLHIKHLALIFIFNIFCNIIYWFCLPEFYNSDNNMEIRKNYYFICFGIVICLYILINSFRMYFNYIKTNFSIREKNLETVSLL